MKRALALVVLAGCFGYETLPKERAAPKLRNIKEAKLLDMDVNLYKQPGLCPGLEGKLYAKAKVQWPKGKPVDRTIGSDVDSLAPASFKVTGPLIHGNKEAHLLPDADVLASVETGFEATIVYTPEPRFTFHKIFRPEYSCYSGWYEDGNGGNGGDGGEMGNNGDVGQSGGNGGNGEQGGRGGNGGRITAYVTVVSTRYYPRLLAVIANDHFFLAPADRPLGFGARGGQGGGGGVGGNGGNGGDQPYESREVPEDGQMVSRNVATGNPGDGGNGGFGGRGGRGGDGGSVEVTYDSRFPELQRMIETDVSGGAGGYGGGGGYAGGGGGTVAEGESAAQGNPGQDGQGAGDGDPGGQGRATVRGGSISSRFSNLRGIAIADTDAARALLANAAPEDPTVDADGHGGGSSHRQRASRSEPSRPEPSRPEPSQPESPRKGKGKGKGSAPPPPPPPDDEPAPKHKKKHKKIRFGGHR